MSLAQHFPFLSPLIGRSFPQPKNDNVACASKSTSDASSLSENISKLDSANGIADCHNQCPQEIKNEVYIKYEKFQTDFFLFCSFTFVKVRWRL